MKVGSRGFYAIMALVDLNLQPNDSLVSLPEIANRQGLSLSYLEQIFMILRQKGFVKSLRGQKGGYVLAYPAIHISVAEVLNAMGEGPRATRCQRHEKEEVAHSKGCLPNGSECLTHHLWKKLESHITSYLSGISLEDVCTKKFDLSFESPGKKDQKCL